MFPIISEGSLQNFTEMNPGRITKIAEESLENPKKNSKESLMDLMKGARW